MSGGGGGSGGGVCICTLSVWGESRKTEVRDPGIKLTSFSFRLTLTQYSAKEFMVWEIKMQRTVVTFRNGHSSLRKYQRRDEAAIAFKDLKILD